MKFKLTPQQRKGGSLVLVGLLGIATGHWVPPEVFGQLLGIFA